MTNNKPTFLKSQKVLDMTLYTRFARYLEPEKITPYYDSHTKTDLLTKEPGNQEFSDYIYLKLHRVRTDHASVR